MTITALSFLIFFWYLLCQILDPVSHFHASDHVPKPGVPDQPLRRAVVFADTRLQIHQVPGDENAGTCEFGVCGLGRWSTGVWGFHLNPRVSESPKAGRVGLDDMEHGSQEGLRCLWEESKAPVDFSLFLLAHGLSLPLE